MEPLPLRFTFIMEGKAPSTGHKIRKLHIVIARGQFLPRLLSTWHWYALSLRRDRASKFSFLELLLGGGSPQFPGENPGCRITCISGAINKNVTCRLIHSKNNERFW